MVGRVGEPLRIRCPVGQAFAAVRTAAAFGGAWLFGPAVPEARVPWVVRLDRSVW